jgi:membrane-associated phospholipid phosphatase
MASIITGYEYDIFISYRQKEGQGIISINRVKIVMSLSILAGLVFCYQSIYSQQTASLSSFILPGSLLCIHSINISYEKDTLKDKYAPPDNISLKQKFVLMDTDNTCLLPDLHVATDSVFNKPKWLLASMLEDQGKLWTSPIRIEKTDLLLWIPVLTTTIVSIIYDEEIYSAIKNFQNNQDWVSKISPIITRGGDNTSLLTVSGLFYLIGVISGNEKAEQTGLIAAQTWFHAGFIVKVGKLFSGRQRPSYQDGKDIWYGFPASLNKYKGEPRPKYDAFPSGHTIEAFALATVIAKQYSEIKIVPVISYSLATGVGLSRITEDTHWLSDVIMGAALGYGIGRYMARERKDTRWILIPKAARNDLTLMATFSF